MFSERTHYKDSETFHTLKITINLYSRVQFFHIHNFNSHNYDIKKCWTFSGSEEFSYEIGYHVCKMNSSGTV